MGAIWLVCDTSGSMIEGGKRLIVRGLVRQVEQFFRLGYGRTRKLQLVLWADQATAQRWDPREEVPRELLECKGSAQGEPLVQLLGTSRDAKFLIITDGFWSDESHQVVKEWKNHLSYDAVRVLRVGADANPRLKGDDVFEAEDFFSAMDGWMDE